MIVFTCMPSWINLYKNKKIYWIYNLGCYCDTRCTGINKECQFYKQLVYILTNKFDNIWYKYETYITKNLDTIYPNKCYKFPHKMFDPEIHKTYNLIKKYDILFYGSIYNKQTDPFRYRLYKLLYELKEKKMFNILILPYSKKNRKL